MNEDFFKKILKTIYIITITILCIIIILDLNMKLYGGIVVIIDALVNIIIKFIAYKKYKENKQWLKDIVVHSIIAIVFIVIVIVLN